MRTFAGESALHHLRRVAWQPRLALSSAGDRHEQAADQAAAQVMRMPAPSIRPMAALRPAQTPAEVRNLLRSPGQALDQATRRFMEPRFGYDFSRVRVHTDQAAQHSAQALQARAYSVGNDIVFGDGQFTPATHAGRQLLAHELAHTVQQSTGAPTSIARQPDPRHARGYAGEQGMGFIHYRQEDGWIFFEGPGGSAGHGVTSPGFDGVAYNTRTGEIHLIDNKSLARQGNVGSATAIDPCRNLGKNLDGLIQRVEAAKDVPGRVRLLGRLRALKTALSGGKPLPAGVKLVVTGVGGRSGGVTPRLQSEGVEFRPEPAPKAPSTAASPKVPAAANPRLPAPATPPVAEPPTAVAARPALPVEPIAAAAPTRKPPIAAVPATATAPAVRPAMPWKAGLKAGGKALLFALIFAGLEYLVRRQLDKELEASIDKAKRGAGPWAQRLKREDPSKPVYMKVKVQSEDYSRYLPFLGWMPEPPVLHMISIEMVREEIDPPLVEVRDNRLDVWRPGVTTTFSYTEPMVP
jgi:hypothetical protein